MNYDQQALTAQLKNGEAAAFAKLVEAHEDMVYNTVLLIVQDVDDADDVTQEVFIQAYRSIEAFKGDAKLSTWLYRIALSKALDHQKMKKRKKRFAVVERMFGIGNDHEADMATFEHPGILLEKKESAATLINALNKLPNNQRTAFTLHKMEGLPYNEIAEVMQTTLYAVESLMSRAKGNLKKLLETHYNKEK